MKKIIDKYNLDKDALTTSFQETCSDKDFKKYVFSLGLNEDKLIKYTSNLKDSFTEYSNCKNCKNKDTCKNNIKGYKYTPKVEDDIITFDYVACKYELKELEANEYQNNIEFFEMPKSLLNASFNDMYKDDKARLPIIKYFKEFMNNYNNEEKPKGLYLNGSFGSGKTYLIASLFNEMARRKEKCAIVYYPEFLRSLKSSFQANGYAEQFNYIKKIPLLLLDDIGAENCSNWSRDEILGPILQYRMENNLPTFFTSNLTLDELETSLSQTSNGVDKVKARRIIERIKQLTINKELISKNRRI